MSRNVLASFTVQPRDNGQSVTVQAWWIDGSETKYKFTIEEFVAWIRRLKAENKLK